MKHSFLGIGIALTIGWTACAPSPQQSAENLLNQAYSQLQSGHWQDARRSLDSLHTTYPRQVDQRRLAKALGDSITYLEALRTAHYADSMLQTLLPQADKLLKQFRYEKNESYEDHGRYVHRLLSTSSNTSRCFLQAYVRDDRVSVVKSYYYGAKKMNQQSFELSSEGMEAVFRGSNHAFEAEGWHEILTLEDSLALQALNFISSHPQAKIRVHGVGETPNRCWTYYLQSNEVQALTCTYQLGYLMKDIRLLEQMQRKASAQQIWYQNKYSESKSAIKAED